MNRSSLSGIYHEAMQVPVRRFLPAALAVSLLAVCGGCAVSVSVGNSRQAPPRPAAGNPEEPAPAGGGLPARPDVQPSAPSSMSLSDALALAMKQNRPLQAVMQERDIARGRVVESFAATLPHLTANGSYARLDEVSSIDFGAQKISMGFVNNYSADLSVFQPLFHGGAIRGAIRTASLASQMSEEQIRAATQGTVFQVSKAYYDVLIAEKMVETTAAAVSSAETHLGDLQKMKKAGVASEYDVLRAGVEVSNLRAELLRQRNALDLARAALLSAVGLPHDSGVTLTDSLEVRPVEAPADCASPAAVADRPDIRMAEFGVKIQEQALRMAMSQYWPQADAFFTYKWGNPDPHSAMSDEWGDAWTAGASASLPLFDGFSRRGKVAQEKARLRQARLNLDAAVEQALLELKQASLSVRDAAELVASQEQNLEQAKEGLRLAEAGFKSGVRTEVEVMDARTALTRTQVIHCQAVYGHELARLSLQLASGRLEWNGADTGDSPAGAEAPQNGDK